MALLGRSTSLRTATPQEVVSPKRRHSLRHTPTQRPPYTIRRQTSDTFHKSNRAHLTHRSNYSNLLLSVDDVQHGGTSSIDSGSEEEGSPCVASPSTFLDHDYSPTDIPPPPYHPKDTSSQDTPRSLANAFKTKLNMTLKSGRSTERLRKTSSSFHLLGHKREKKDKPLYDDGLNPVYPPPPRETDQRDQYGFVKQTQWLSQEDYDSFERLYHPVIERRHQKWRQLIADNKGHWPQKSSKFKRYIRKGIPSELRGQAWFHYSGAEEKMAKHPGDYQSYVDKASDANKENEYLEIIERDLHRTFPDNIQFKSKSPDANVTDVPVIQSLRRLLSAFSVYSPSIGYCQSLNYIAGLLLLFMPEEKAFWTFIAVIEDILPPNIYDVTMEGANIDQHVLMMLLSERCPQLWHRVGDKKSFWECEEVEVGMPTTSLVTSHWFLTLFINILPIESVLRVWDCLFYEGQRVLFRVALGIFKINEQAILNVNDSLEVFQVIQNMPKTMLDCHRLIDETYHKYASTTRLSEVDLVRRRQLFKTRREERRKNLPVESKLKRRKMRGTIIHKALEARRFVERAKTVKL